MRPTTDPTPLPETVQSAIDAIRVLCADPRLAARKVATKP